MFVHRFTGVSVVMTEWVIWAVFTLLHAIMKLLLDNQMFLYCRFTVLTSDCAERTSSAGQTDVLHGHISVLQKQWNEAHCTVFICTFPKSCDKRNDPDKTDVTYNWLQRKSDALWALWYAAKLNIQHLIKLFHSSEVESSLNSILLRNTGSLV